jgi:acyl-CoA thioester hydrolase
MVSDLVSDFQVSPSTATKNALFSAFFSLLRHVNNVVYFRYFENARLEYFRRMGWFEYEEQTGIGPILAATQCRFRKPLTYPDTILIGARVISVGEDRFTLEHHVVSESLGAVAAEGQGVVVSYDYRRGEKVPLPDELRRRIGDLEAQAGGRGRQGPEG